MTELLNSFQAFVHNVRIVDFLDIITISVILYLLINWFWESASKHTIASLTLLISMYILARLTEMYLTEIFIEGLFIVILIGLVVVFQSDIRRLVDQFGRWSFRKNGDTVSGEQNLVSDIITQAATQMAENRTGALIALKGSEDWERHINGGIKLNGDVSLPMLRSIFNPTAPGHDGAVLIENGKIKKFGAHLPLSTRLQTISRGGTRHAAALGLSELCDALVVVVSEERGVTSVAQGGQIKVLESASELKERLLTFESYHQKAREEGWSHRWKKVNWQTALVSTVLSLLLWFSFAYNPDTVYRTYAVPIEYRNLDASNVVLQDSVPIQARVTLAGPEQAFRLLNPSDLVISFNLDSESFSSDSVIITERNLDLPSDLQLFDVSPRQLNIIRSNVTRIRVPVNVETTGALPSVLSLNSISIEPRMVPLLISKGQSLNSITVDPIDLSSIDSSTTVTRKLKLPEGVSMAREGIKQVKVEITVSKNEQ